MRNYKTITTALTPETIKALKKQADEERRGLATLLRIIIEDYVASRVTKKEK